MDGSFTLVIVREEERRRDFVRTELVATAIGVLLDLVQFIGSVVLAVVDCSVFDTRNARELGLIDDGRTIELCYVCAQKT
jgi:hypothetical protein